ncbi:MAG TPA: hypothetical protein ENN61_06870, partial [Bacteroidaceae bacterium]|nr:hypothetical protein [Bacteroidaceae bacterium]
MKRKGLSPGKIVWSRFIKNPLSIIGVIFILIAFIVSFLGYVIAPDKTTNSNTQILEIATEPPGFRVSFLRVRQNKPRPEKSKLLSYLTGADDPFQSVPIDSIWFEEGKVYI